MVEGRLIDPELAVGGMPVAGLGDRRDVCVFVWHMPRCLAQRIATMLVNMSPGAQALNDFPIAICRISLPSAPEFPDALLRKLTIENRAPDGEAADHVADEKMTLSVPSE